MLMRRCLRSQLLEKRFNGRVPYGEKLGATASVLVLMQRFFCKGSVAAGPCLFSTMILLVCQ